MRSTVIVIPALNPDTPFLSLLSDLRQAGFSRVVVVNDGSRPDRLPLFDAAREQGASILTHEVNRGKGCALKTAFAHILDTFGPEAQAVCVDADGQHQIPDIIAVAECLAANPEKLILGCRDFGAAHIPLRSRVGNKLTRAVFGFLSGVHVTDTQTGLRGLSGVSMQKFLGCRGNRFEYEMNMLIDARALGVEIQEVPISTVYLAKNESSHFNPLVDSVRIYAVFGRFLLSSVISFGIDYALFCLLSLLLFSLDQTLSIFLATLIARVASSLVNFGLNRRKVFHAKGSRAPALLRYYVLCILQMAASAGLVSLFVWLTHGSEALIKLPVDILLFFLSFQLQREWVFRHRTPRQPRTPSKRHTR